MSILMVLASVMAIEPVVSSTPIPCNPNADVYRYEFAHPSGMIVYEPYYTTNKCEVEGLRHENVAT
jgi:hypothetical protein